MRRSRLSRTKGPGIAAALFAAGLTTWIPAAQATPPTATCGCTAHFEPPIVGAGAFAADTLSGFSGSQHVAIGSATVGGYNPLVIYNSDGSIRTKVIKYQFMESIGGSYVFFGGHLRVSTNVPFVLQIGESGSLDGVQYKAPPPYPVLGDIRFGLDYKLLGKGDKSGFHFAAGLEGSVPTGSPENYSGIGTTQLIPKLYAAGTIGTVRNDVVSVKYAARLSTELRPALSLTPEVINFGLVLGLHVKKRLTVDAEVFGTTVSTGGNFFKADQTPLEGMLAVHYRGEKFRFGAGFGPGTKGLGSPLARVILSVEYVTAQPKFMPRTPSDRDGDGVSDGRDACPDVKGVKTDDPATNGCPAAPPEPVEGVIALSVCPDGTVETRAGCAPPDRDGDGIPDSEDACPLEPGIRDPDPKKNGCPVAKVVEQEIRSIPPVTFRAGTALLTAESNTALAEIARILKENPVLALRIEGHTDNVGGREFNKMLSMQRANAIRDQLVKLGVDPKQLKAAGFGQDRPIAPNTTEEGQAKNRRVELFVERRQDAPQGAPP